jgi:hypothetical protein
MKILRSILVCTLLASLTGASIYACLLLHATAVTIAAVPGEIAITRSALITQVQLARVESLSEIDKQADGLRAELHGDVRLLNGQVGAIASRADKQLTTIQTTALMLGGKLDAPLAAVTAATQEVGPLLRASQVAVQHVSSITSQIDDAAPLYLDCDAGNCLYDQVQGTAKAVERTMQAVAKVAPEVAKATADNAQNVGGITADVHVMTTAVLKPKSFWGKLWAGVTVASRFAGMF